MDVTLPDMTDAEFEAYLERLIPEYAKEGGRATGMAPEQALADPVQSLGRAVIDGNALGGDGANRARVLRSMKQQSHT